MPAQYVQSATLAQVEAKHPFPWREETMVGPRGGLLRMVDAAGQEVNLFELTALAKLFTSMVVQSRQRSAEAQAQGSQA